MDNIGWARGATVRFFLDATMNAEQKRLARWALAEWSRAGSVNNARVRFEEDFTGQNFQFRLLNGSLGGNTPAFAQKQFTPDDPPEPNLDFQGYNNWLGKLELFGGDYRAAEMVEAFITSIEYRRRFGTP